MHALSYKHMLVAAIVHSSDLFFSLIQSAGEVLSGVYVPPQNKEESRRNVEQVLQFISSRRIRMPHISARGKESAFSCCLPLPIEGSVP